MDDRSKPVEAASSSGFRNDHCTELEHSENIVASAQAQSRGSSAFHVRNVGLTAIAVLPDRMRGLRREVVNALAESMKAQGVLQPIILRRSEAPGFLLVAGHHRLEAAQPPSLVRCRTAGRRRWTHGGRSPSSRERDALRLRELRAVQSMATLSRRGRHAVY
jgi:ParB-like nuclease domain